MRRQRRRATLTRDAAVLAVATRRAFPLRQAKETKCKPHSAPRSNPLISDHVDPLGLIDLSTRRVRNAWAKRDKRPVDWDGRNTIMFRVRYLRVSRR
jgi:hypothetical protein